MAKTSNNNKHANYGKNINNSEKTDNICDSNGNEPLPRTEEIIFSGLVLKKDYILLKRIGHGNNAGVWMVYQISTKKFMAMKVQDYQCYNDGCREIAIIKKINEYCKNNPTIESYCIKMLDFFVYEDADNVKFVCSIYDLYAGSIQMLLNNGKYKYGLPINVVKNITKQLLKALEILHDKLNVIHTDVKPENILFKGLPDKHVEIIKLFDIEKFTKKYENILAMHSKDEHNFLDELDALAMESVDKICKLESIDEGSEELQVDEDSENEDFFSDEDDEFIEGEYDEDDSDENDDNIIFNQRDQSINDIVEHLDYQDIHNLDASDETDYDFVSVLNNRETTTDFVQVIDDKYITQCETALTDFGNSYFYKSRTRNEIQDRRYRAPEVILNLNYGYACDIWSVGCIVFELLTGFPLFDPNDNPINKDIHHLYLIEKMLGSIPFDMKKRSDRKKFLFDRERKYHIKNVAYFLQVPIEERLINQFLFDEKDAKEIIDFLMCGLCLKPEERWTAAEMLTHKWLN